MPMSCEEYYRQLQVKCEEVLAASFLADTTSLQAASHSYIGDLEQWHRILAGRPECDLLKASLLEYQFALLAVAQGLYRQAFMALRLSFELLLAAVHFSANELELRSWMRGGRDISWRVLVDPDNGVLSKRFVRVFYEELEEEAARYRAIAETVYRECSEYVHGNAPTHSILAGQIVFQQAVFTDWHAKAKTIRLVSSFALCARYVRLADEAARRTLETVLLDNLGHIPAIRLILGAPVEHENV